MRKLDNQLRELIRYVLNKPAEDTALTAQRRSLAKWATRPPPPKLCKIRRGQLWGIVCREVPYPMIREAMGLPEEENEESKDTSVTTAVDPIPSE